MIYYFAYGSNMDEDDFDKWCENHGKEKRFKNIFKNIRPAKIENYKLRFNYYSQNRCGGTANLMSETGTYVYGLLTEIDDKDLELISEKEGKKTYNKISVDVKTLKEGGKTSNVTTYKVFENKEEKRDCPPTDKYLCLIIRNAIKYKFPLDYIEYLNQFQTKK
jgi:cation transport regulator ChaC